MGDMEVEAYLAGVADMLGSLRRLCPQYDASDLERPCQEIERKRAKRSEAMIRLTLVVPVVTLAGLVVECGCLLRLRFRQQNLAHRGCMIKVALGTHGRSS